MISKSKVSLALFLILGSAACSQAALIVNAPTPSSSGSLVITHDITIAITANGNMGTLYLDEVVPSGSYAGADVSPFLSVLLNGNPLTVGYTRMVDRMGFSTNDYTDNDGFIGFSADDNQNGYAVSPGDIVTILAGSYVLTTGMLNFDAPPGGSFEGQVFIADWGGNRLSNNTTLVPEPASAGLLLGGLVLAGCVRRRPLRG